MSSPLSKDATCRHCGGTYASALSHRTDGYCSAGCAWAEGVYE